MPFADFANAVVEAATPLLTVIRAINPVWLLVTLAVHSLSLLARCRIWQNLLQAAVPGTRVSFRDAALPYAIGIGASVALPFRGGDALRILAARRRLPSATTATLAATLMAESLAGLVVLPLLGVGALALGVAPGAGALVAAGVGLGLLAVALFVAWRVSRRSVRARQWWSSAADGVRICGSPRRFASATVGWSLLDWPLRIATAYALLQAFSVPASMAAAAAVVVVDSMSTALPLTPGGVGAQQALVTGVLAGSASTSRLLAFSTGSQLLIYAANALAGIAAMLVVYGRLWVTPGRVPAHA